MLNVFNLLDKRTSDTKDVNSVDEFLNLKKQDMTKLTNVEQINSEAKQVSGISSSTSKTNNKIKNLSEVQQQMR